ncbi:uncharacterized protein LOC127762644 [Oryza glaberrima]|uniref:uncharacterized protein LOC127762644 n=1 Tax=Oryza glaberrima TaxID=4538 RepID=UPI00224C3757|nr:uncharacterized protein LOC127762644 [Oryza glaberrima]
MSSPPPSAAHDAVFTRIVQAIADSIRASYDVPAGLSVDQAVIRSVADAAATRAETAAHDALATHLRPLLQAADQDASSTLVDNTSLPPAAGVVTAPTSGSMPTPVVLSSSDLAAIAAQLAALSTTPGRTPTPPPVVPTPPVPDAATLAALHAQALAVGNIKALVPVVLDVTSANYARWRGMFLVVLGKYALTDHVLSDDVPLDQPDWSQMECVVIAWLYGTISNYLLQELRAINLSAEFYGFCQGDMSAAEYCRRLRAMADEMADLDEPITDRTLVLNFVRGLNEKYHNLQTIIPLQRPFPTFMEARSQLLLAEITKGGSSTSTGTASAFVANTTGKTSGNNGGSGGNGNNRRSRGKGKGNTGGGSGSTGGSGGNSGSGSGGTAPQAAGGAGAAQRAPVPWPTPLHPWASTIQLADHAPGLLGPAPGLARSPFAGSAVAGLSGYMGSQAGPGPAMYGAPPSVVPPSPTAVPPPPPQWFGPSQWDPQALASSFNTTTLATPTSNECLDPFGLFVKDYHTKIEIARCNSSGDLYPFSADVLPSATSAQLD